MLSKLNKESTKLFFGVTNDIRISKAKTSSSTTSSGVYFLDIFPIEIIDIIYQFCATSDLQNVRLCCKEIYKHATFVIKKRVIDKFLNSYSWESLDKKSKIKKSKKQVDKDKNNDNVPVEDDPRGMFKDMDDDEFYNFMIEFYGSAKAAQAPLYRNNIAFFSKGRGKDLKYVNLHIDYEDTEYIKLYDPYSFSFMMCMCLFFGSNIYFFLACRHPPESVLMDQLKGYPMIFYPSIPTNFDHVMQVKPMNESNCNYKSGFEKRYDIEGIRLVMDGSNIHAMNVVREFTFSLNYL